MEERKDYLTIESGLDYRTIAEIISSDGVPMGHSTVRNMIIRSMEKVAASLMAVYGVVGDPLVVAENASFQRLIAEKIRDIYAARTCDGTIV